MCLLSGVISCAFIFTSGFPISCFAFNSSLLENEQTAVTITDEDFQILVKEREVGSAGFHKNIDPTLYIPARDNAVLDWVNLEQAEKLRLQLLQEEMFRCGKITMIVLTGGEATRFGGPKNFVTVSDDLGEFLEIKAANLNWVQKKYGTTVPMYLLTSEKRLPEFKKALRERDFYGLKETDFRWFVQGAVDTFIPSPAELQVNFKGKELDAHLRYAKTLQEANPDGIYRFEGERRKMPTGHFDAIAAFAISGLLSECLKQGIEYAPVVNIDNLQALLKNDGMIAYFAERGNDFGFLLAEKNLTLSLTDASTRKILQDKIIVRFKENILSFDGLEEFTQFAEKDGYKYQIDQTNKSIQVVDIKSGNHVLTNVSIKPETGGTLVQKADAMGIAIGEPIMKEGFELPLDFNHANAPFFNTNTIIVNLKSILKFLNISQEELSEMSFEERSSLVRKKLVLPTKANFEFKNHEVEGEFPFLGVVKMNKTKIPVVQVTRIMLQAAHLKGATVGYIFAPRDSVFSPVKEPEDLPAAAEHNRKSLKEVTLYKDKNN